MLPIVILAGGLATRLGELSKSIPKSLIQIKGEPFIFHQMRLLKKNEAKNILICLGHMGEKIEEVLGDGKAFGLNIRYSYDGPELLGTGGAIANALPLLPDFFMILYGDSYLDVNYRAVAKAYLYSGKQGLMTIYKNNNCFDKSNVCYINGKIKLYDKNISDVNMEYVDYGILCLTKEVFKNNAKKRFDLAEILTDLSIKKELAGYEIKERFYEIGSRNGIEDLELYLSSQAINQ
jgi:NDP-sugar pyrophosphorylase family protein